jgi:hypothetical protein
MMWIANPTPKQGDVRVRRKFAWWPIKFLVDTDLYYVWLESYQVTELYTLVTTNEGEGYYDSNLQWEVVKREPLY